LSTALVEPAVLDPAAGVKTALSNAVPAENEVRQVTVTLWPVAATDTSPHPPSVLPRFLNAIVPDGAAALTLDVTVAIKVRVWFATGALGDANIVVELPVVTTAVGAELTGPPLPPALVADS
jgi:hypothetical protein